MRTEDVKKFIHTTKRNLSAEDVKTIISVIKKEGRITKDRTGEGYVYHNWEGPPPLPALPEDAGLICRGTNPGSFGAGVTISPKAFKENPSLEALSRMLSASDLHSKSELIGDLSHSRFKSVALVHIVIGIGTVPYTCILRIMEKSPTSMETRRDLLASLLASGGWPVTLTEGEHAIIPHHTAAGTVAWQEERKQLVFTWPDVSLRRVVDAYARTLAGAGVKCRDTRTGLGLPDAVGVSWRKLNQYFKEIEAAATPSMTIGLYNIEWSLNGYEAFSAMVAMQAALEPDSQIITKMFEFEFAGQSGFMELGHEKSGFCAWFSFDDEKPFKALQKAIGFPLKSWG